MFHNGIQSIILLLLFRRAWLCTQPMSKANSSLPTSFLQDCVMLAGYTTDWNLKTIIVIFQSVDALMRKLCTGTKSIIYP